MIITQMIFKIIDDIRLIYPLTYAFKVLQNSFFFMIMDDKVILLIQEKLDDHLNLGQHFYNVW